MSFRKVALLIAIIGSLALPVFAQDILARATIDGKIVELLSDNTWRYTETDALTENGNCQSIHARVNFCFDETIWSKVTPATALINAAYRHDDRHYGQFIVEGIGTNDGMTFEFMREVVVANAASATGQSKDEIIIVDVVETSLDGNPAETMIYMAKFDTLEVIYANTMMVTDTLLVQVMTYAIASEFSEKHQNLHTGLLESTVIN